MQTKKGANECYTLVLKPMEGIGGHIKWIIIIVCTN